MSSTTGMRLQPLAAVASAAFALTLHHGVSWKKDREFRWKVHVDLLQKQGNGLKFGACRVLWRSGDLQHHTYLCTGEPLQVSTFSLPKIQMIETLTQAIRLGGVRK